MLLAGDAGLASRSIFVPFAYINQIKPDIKVPQCYIPLEWSSQFVWGHAASRHVLFGVVMDESAI